MANLLQSIIDFFVSLFGGKKEQVQPETTTEEPVVKDPSKCMNESSIAFLVSSLDESEIESVKAEIEANENAGKYTYDLKTSQWMFHIENGNITHCTTISDKAKSIEESVETTTTAADPSKCMSKATISFILAGLPESERPSVEAKIHENENNGIYEYDLHTSKWIFHIINGQIQKCIVIG